MVIFTRTYDFLSWLLPATNHFPRAHRFSFTNRLLEVSFDLYEALVEAQEYRGATRLKTLQQAAIHLDKVRLYLRLAQRWKWLSEGQYQHVAVMTTEIGKLLGGWQRATKNAVR